MKNTAIMIEFEGELSESQVAEITKAAIQAVDNTAVGASQKNYDPEWGGVTIYQP